MAALTKEWPFLEVKFQDIHCYDIYFTQTIKSKMLIRFFPSKVIGYYVECVCARFRIKLKNKNVSVHNTAQSQKLALIKMLTFETL